MSMPEDKAIESQLRECVSDAVPHEVEVRLRARLAEFRSRLNARETVAATPVRRLRLTTGWKLGLTCAAAGLVVAALGLVLWPRASFADVAAAVFQQSWIRVHPRATAAMRASSGTRLAGTSWRRAGPTGPPIGITGFRSSTCMRQRTRWSTMPRSRGAVWRPRCGNDGGSCRGASAS